MTPDRGSPTDGRASIIGRLASAPLHPVLFAAVIVLSAWFDAAISPYPLVRPLLIAVLGAAVLTVVAGLAFRSPQIGGLVATAIIWVLWSRHLLDLAETAIHRLGVGGIVWAAAVVLGLVLVARLVLRRANRWTVAGATSFLNRGALLLALVTLLMGGVTGKVGQAISDLSQGEDLQVWLASPGTDAGREGPDVYAVLLDGYPRADVLADAFDIDNEPFISALGERGFAVAGVSHSDYIWTHTTVPSTLHMDYVEHIPALDPVASGEAPQQPTIRNAIDDNPVFALAREHGYTTVSIGSGFEQVTARKTDVFVDSGDMNEFEVSLLASTFLGDVVNLVAPAFAASEWASRTEHNLDTLPVIASADGDPVFVWAHVPAPHQPTVFAADGSVVEVPLTDTFYGDSPMERGEDPAEFRERYRAQLTYLNDRILETVDGIARRSSEPPVILLFADHGSASRVDWTDAEPTEVDPALVLERTGTLLATLTPEHPDAYPDDASPIDLFRVLFDAYFETDYGRPVPPDPGGQIPPVDASVLDD
jgi:hypothetical protein